MDLSKVKYDIYKRRKVVDITVKDLINLLKEFPEDALVLFAGFKFGWIHVGGTELKEGDIKEEVISLEVSIFTEY